jgi:hypothetical protein
MTAVRRLNLVIHHTSSIICAFHIHVDFGLKIYILFPHIFWFLHHNGVGISGFTLTYLRGVEDEGKSILSCERYQQLDDCLTSFASERILQNLQSKKKQIGQRRIAVLAECMLDYSWNAGPN